MTRFFIYLSNQIKLKTTTTTKIKQNDYKIINIIIQKYQQKKIIIPKTKPNLTKCFCMYITDDECFYVGMAHPAQSARKGNNYVPNDYRPFQCCPTKLERQTRVPKMSAQKLSHLKDSDDKSRKSQFAFSDSSKSSSSSTTTPTSSSSRKIDSKSKAESKNSGSSSSKKSTSKKSKKDDDDDDDDDVVVPVKDLKKATPKSKDANKAKPGQKGLLGIAKIVNWF